MKPALPLLFCTTTLACGTALAGDPNTDTDTAASRPNAATPRTLRATPSIGLQTEYQNTVNGGASTKAAAEFIEDAAQGDNMDMVASHHVVTNSSNDDVRRHAQRMLKDDQTLGQPLKDIAARKGITVPTDMETSRNLLLERLKGKTGTQFDTAYAKMMARDHQLALAKFRQVAQTGSVDANIRRFAQASLSALQDHLQLTNKPMRANASAVGTSKLE